MSDYIFRETQRIYEKYATRDPFELLDAIGAVTHFSNDYGENGLKGYSIVMNRIKYAVINANLGWHEQRIVAGHEAGHLILHMSEIMNSPVRMLKDFNLFDNSGKIEYEANSFLADFMLDDNDVMEYVRDCNRDFFDTARALYIPPALFSFKLFSMMRRGFDVESPIDLDSKFLGR